MKSEIIHRSKTSNILKTEKEARNNDLSLWAIENEHLKAHPNIDLRQASPASWWAEAASNYQAWIDAGGFFQGEEDVCTEPRLDRAMMSDDPKTQEFFSDAKLLISKVKPG